MSHSLAGSGQDALQAAQDHVFQFAISGLANPIVPGFVPHGDPEVSGIATLIFHGGVTLDYRIELSNDRYRVTQAHLYNITRTSQTSGNPAHGDSLICWGGRWESNAPGGDSSDFLVGHGYTNRRLPEVIENDEDWFLILHTEGGHFALDEKNELIAFDPDRSGVQKTSVTGVPESERPTRFNNRVGRRLTSRVLHEQNTNDPTAPLYDPFDPANLNATPFPDAKGHMWVEPNGTGGWRLTSEAVEHGFDLETEYLFYLYDDQGPLWDFGGPEAAMTGILQRLE